MEFIKKKVKLKYIVIFIFVFVATSFFFSVIGGDVLWNYGFSYALSKGERPYLDFNMIITPFYPFFMSLFFKMFSHNIIVFYLVNSALITYMFYLLFKMYDYKAWILFVFLFFPLPAVIFPTYNLFLILLLVILLYLEKNDGNDYLIGLILGISILTKQSVGVFLCLPSFYYLFKNHKKVLKRFVGCLVPCIIFLIYLFFNRALKEFFDLCLFGMFDFSTKNGKVFNSLFFIILIMIGYLIYKIFKDKKNVFNYYILTFSSITIPLFDVNHFLYFLFVFVILFIEKLKINRKELYFCCSIFTVVYVVVFFVVNIGFDITYPNHFTNFEYSLMYNNNGEFEIRDKVNKYIQKNKDKNLIFLSSEAYFYKITNEMKISCFDLINKGNNGYSSTKKLINKIKKMHGDIFFLISYDEYLMEVNSRQQIDKNFMKYVIDNGEFVEEINCFRVYKLHRE